MEMVRRVGHGVASVVLLRELGFSPLKDRGYHHYANGGLMFRLLLQLDFGIGKRVEFTRQCHPPCLHGCICPKMGHLQAVDPPSAIKGWEFGWVNEGALRSPEFWRRAGPWPAPPAALPAVAMIGHGGSS